MRMGTAALLGWDFGHAIQLAGVVNCGWVVLTQYRKTSWRLEQYNSRAVEARPGANSTV
jgi:hypothetical protein